METDVRIASASMAGHGKKTENDGAVHEAKPVVTVTQAGEERHSLSDPTPSRSNVDGTAPGEKEVHPSSDYDSKRSLVSEEGPALNDACDKAQERELTQKRRGISHVEPFHRRAAKPAPTNPLGAAFAAEMTSKMNSSTTPKPQKRGPGRPPGKVRNDARARAVTRAGDRPAIPSKSSTPRSSTATNRFSGIAHKSNLSSATESQNTAITASNNFVTIERGDPCLLLAPPIFEEWVMGEGRVIQAVESHVKIESKQMLSPSEMQSKLEALTGVGRILKDEEPPVSAEKGHRDYMMMEMMWMSNDFGEERKWKQTVARKIAKAVKQFHRNKATLEAKKQKQMQLERKKRAARIGRDIKKFWGKIDKIVSYKQKLIFDERRKRDMDKHLRFLVSQTERYSSMLATTMLKREVPVSDLEVTANPSSMNVKSEFPPENVLLESTEHPIEDRQQRESEEEYIPSEDEIDDETTIEAAEREAGFDNQKEELTELEREQDLPIEELRAQYAAMMENMASSPEWQVVNDISESGRSSTSSLDAEAEASVDSEDYKPESDITDDEETIEAEEKIVNPKDRVEELADLKYEADMSLDDLLAKYRALVENPADFDSSDDGEANDARSSMMDSIGLSHTDEDDYNPGSEESDDEFTIAAAEQEENIVDRDEELAALEDEANLPIEDLVQRYQDFVQDSMKSGSDVELESSQSQSSEKESSENSTHAMIAYQHVDHQGEQNGGSHHNFRKRKRNDGRAIEEVTGSEHYHESKISMETETFLNPDGRESLDGHEGENGQLELGNKSRDSSVAEEKPTSFGTVVIHHDHNSVVDKAKSIAEPTMESDNMTKLFTSLNSCDDDALAARRIKRPFLLSPQLRLREYQQVGLNWLVSMYERRLNGILADEMGLGKTIQTISLLAHLACERGLWGPHLIIVPTSCLINWEMEFKRWCPGFKILTYYGSAKRRKELRQGWTKLNAFHVCITSYQLVVQDASSFRRKKWYYMILDEAHNIKNFKSQRWQTLLNFNTQRRLLLTGTPLQNDLMELWSLMHFLMPHVFRSRKEFGYWFNNPLSVMVEGDTLVDESLVSRLHGIIRPFLLRRLKKDVEKQLPAKYEHIITCKLSKRQRFLYEDFMSRSSTRKAVHGGNFFGMMNVLMQLRKVCNHPDLFEPRHIVSSFDVERLKLEVPSNILYMTNEQRIPQLDLAAYNCNLLEMEMEGRDPLEFDIMKSMIPPRRLMEERPYHWGILPEVPQPSDALGLPPDVVKAITALHAARQFEIIQRRHRNIEINLRRSEARPIYGRRLRSLVSIDISPAALVHKARGNAAMELEVSDVLRAIVPSPSERLSTLMTWATHVVCYVPRARVTTPVLDTLFPKYSRQHRDDVSAFHITQHLSPVSHAYYEADKRTKMFFPDKRLLQFDCGKLQELDSLLRDLKQGRHRCLIFTQMSSMLDILEIFLNIHGHTYLRLDGSTKVDARQRLMDRFNEDQKIFVFILSTRSGGLGINLTGADTVIFYDSDWNPAMDAQAQDRAHRIGQTRDVHIYRLVSEHTVEENILKKANQKRHLDFLVMSKGEFTTDFFSKSSLRELVGNLDEHSDENNSTHSGEIIEEKHEVDEELEDEEEEEVVLMNLEISDDENKDSEDEPTTSQSPPKGNKALARRKSFDVADNEHDNEVSTAEIEQAMAQLEDADDYAAMTGARKEAHLDDGDFDDRNLPSPSPSPDAKDADKADQIPDDLPEDEGEYDFQDDDEGDDDDEEGGHSKQEVKQEAVRRRAQEKLRRRAEKEAEKAREQELEAEQERQLQAWRAKVSLDTFEDSLTPIERMALNFRETVDPPWGWVSVPVDPIDTEKDMEFDVEEIERAKALEEMEQLQGGELIAAELPAGELETLEDIFVRERRRLKRESKRRKLTGEDWVDSIDADSGSIFYYNLETHESTWNKPSVLIAQEIMTAANRQRYAGLPSDIVLRIARYLEAVPDRRDFSLVCKSWNKYANHRSLWHHVRSPNEEDERLASQYDGPIKTLQELLSNAGNGDTFLLSPGVHRLSKIVVRQPVRLLADGSNVVIEIVGSLNWEAHGGLIRGITFRRCTQAVENTSKRGAQSFATVAVRGGVLSLESCDVNHHGGDGAAIVVERGGKLYGVKFKVHGASRGSGLFVSSGRLILLKSTIMGNGICGVTVLAGDAVLKHNSIRRNRGPAIRLFRSVVAIVEDNDLRDNALSSGGKVMDVDLAERCLRRKGNLAASTTKRGGTNKVIQSGGTKPKRSIGVPSPLPSASDSDGNKTPVESSTATLGNKQPLLRREPLIRFKEDKLLLSSKELGGLLVRNVRPLSKILKKPMNKETKKERRKVDENKEESKRKKQKLGEQTNIEKSASSEFPVSADAVGNLEVQHAIDVNGVESEEIGNKIRDKEVSESGLPDEDAAHRVSTVPMRLPLPGSLVQKEVKRSQPPATSGEPISVSLVPLSGQMPPIFHGDQVSSQHQTTTDSTTLLEITRPADTALRSDDTVPRVAVTLSAPQSLAVLSQKDSTTQKLAHSLPAIEVAEHSSTDNAVYSDEQAGREDAAPDLSLDIGDGD